MMCRPDDLRVLSFVIAALALLVAPLAKLKRCCADRAMSVPEMIRQLDSMNGTQLFSRLYDQAVTSTEVPDFESLYDRLGLRVSDDQVSLGGIASQATLRAGFIAPPAFNR